MKIVLTDAKTVFDELVTPAPLRELGEVDEYGLLKYDDVAEKIADADFVVVNKTILDSYTLRLAKKLKYIGLFATAVPIAPKPTIPNVLPASSLSGYTNGEKVGLRFHIPS